MFYEDFVKNMPVCLCKEYSNDLGYISRWRANYFWRLSHRYNSWSH